MCWYYFNTKGTLVLCLFASGLDGRCHSAWFRWHALSCIYLYSSECNTITSNRTELDEYCSNPHSFYNTEQSVYSLLNWVSRSLVLWDEMQSSVVDAEWPVDKKCLKIYEAKTSDPPMTLWWISSLSAKPPYSLLLGIILHVTLLSYRQEDISGYSGKKEIWTNEQ